MKLKEVLDKTVQFFKEKKIETPRLDAEILFSEALGFKSRVDIYLQYEKPLKEEELHRCREFVRRRASGEPVAYILGKKDFYGYSFVVGPGVLIPRPETELLVEKALQWLKEKNLDSPQILDLGCGSGCLGFSILKADPKAKLICIEKSSEAITIAKVNAEKLGLVSQVEIIEGESERASFPAESFDLILANPPYISTTDSQVNEEVRKFEPAMALFAENEGLQFLESWSSKAAPWLKSQSWMGFEMGYQQGPKMKAHFEDLKIFDSVSIIKDLAGLDRHIIGERHG